MTRKCSIRFIEIPRRVNVSSQMKDTTISSFFNIFSALKGTGFYILFFVTAAGVVLCGSPKKQPRTS